MLGCGVGNGTVRPTTKDLARHAGVSLATVDRVLNERAGVRPATVQKVQSAIKEIGFIRDVSAANLARGRGYRMLFLLPASNGGFIRGINDRIAEANEAFGVERVSATVEFLPENDPYSASTLLDSITLEEIDGVAIMAPATPQVRDAVSRLRGRGVSVVTFISRQPNDEANSFIGIDNIAAGRTAARMMGRYLGDCCGAILVICETMQAQDSRERRAGFDEVIEADFSSLRLLPTLETYGSTSRAQQILQNVADSRQQVSGAYITTAAVEPILPFLTPLLDAGDRTVIAHERTPFTEDALRNKTLDIVITQNAGHLVRSAIRTLKADVDKRNILESQEKVRIEIVVRDNL